VIVIFFLDNDYDLTLMKDLYIFHFQFQKVRKKYCLFLALCNFLYNAEPSLFAFSICLFYCLI
jgi:hypothetical protein